MSMIKDFKKKVLDNLSGGWSTNNMDILQQAHELALQDTISEWNENYKSWHENPADCARFYIDCVLNGA